MAFSATAQSRAQIFVRPLADAPASWRLDERVARALSAHGFAARLDDEALRGYVVAGRARVPEAPRADLLVEWEVFDVEGALLRRFTQLASAPSGAGDDRALDVIAEAAAGGVTLALPEAPALLAGRRMSAPSPAPAHWAQVGAFSRRDQAERWYGELSARRSDLLAGLSHVVRPVDLGAPRGVWYRVRVGPFGDEAAAHRLCRALVDAAVDCFVPEAG